MSIEEFIAALDLPAGVRVNRRVPKKLLLENGAPTAADKRYITGGIEELLWVAALKPNTIGVIEYRDEVREYLEIAVLHMRLCAGAKVERLIEIVHRAIPYPVLLFTEYGEFVGFSAAHKRWSLGEAGKTVLDSEIISVEWGGPLDTVSNAELALGHQPRNTLYTLYQGWIDTLLALQAARVTGRFVKPASIEHAMIRYEALQEYARLNAEMVRLRVAAEKEKQLSKQVDLNIELKRVEATKAIVRKKL